MLSCNGHRERKIMMLKHYGIWWIVLLLYTHLVHTSMSILNCPSLTMAGSVSYNKPNMCGLTSNSDWWREYSYSTA